MLWSRDGDGVVGSQTEQTRIQLIVHDKLIWSRYVVTVFPVHFLPQNVGNYTLKYTYLTMKHDHTLLVDYCL